MKLPRRLRKWIRGRHAGSEEAPPFGHPAGGLEEIAPKGLIFKLGGGLLVMAMVTVFLFAPDDPARYCRCDEGERKGLEQAKRSRTEQEALELQEEYELRRNKHREAAKAVRTPAAERVRQALKAWEREQAEGEAADRAAVESMEEDDAAGEPAGAVAPR